MAPGLCCTTWPCGRGQGERHWEGAPGRSVSHVALGHELTRSALPSSASYTGLSLRPTITREAVEAMRGLASLWGTRSALPYSTLSYPFPTLPSLHPSPPVTPPYAFLFVTPAFVGPVQGTPQLTPPLPSQPLRPGHLVPAALARGLSAWSTQVSAAACNVATLR